MSTPSARRSASEKWLAAALAVAALASGRPGVAGEGAPGEAPAAATAQAPAAEGRAGDQPIGAEDLLEISVFEVPELSRTVRVSEHGTISLPLIGAVEVAGLTAGQLEARLRDLLSSKYVNEPQVMVFVREFASRKVSVIGAVGKPGVYEMTGPRTLLEVLSQAGGLTDEAGAELFVIRRGGAAGGDGDGAERLAVGIAGLLANSDPARNLEIAPGDVISVPLDRQVYVYVDGAVKTPGRIEQLASRPITLLQAIAKAGGTTERANLKGVQILRQNGGATPEVVQVDLKRLRAGKGADPLLRDGDIVVVPETFF